MEAITIPQSQYWQLSISGPGETVTGLKDIAQSILNVLTTIKGSDPLRPTFGSDIWEYVDLPQPEAIPLTIKAMFEAVQLWEPRATITRIIPTPNSNGQVKYTLYWTTELGQSETILSL